MGISRTKVSSDDNRDSVNSKLKSNVPEAHQENHRKTVEGSGVLCILRSYKTSDSVSLHALFIWRVDAYIFFGTIYLTRGNHMIDQWGGDYRWDWLLMV